MREDKTVNGKGACERCIAANKGKEGWEKRGDGAAREPCVNITSWAHPSAKPTFCPLAAL